MKVLITGATGFLGRHIVPALLDKGHQVIATSRSSGKAQSFEWWPHVTYVEHDLNHVSNDCFNLFHAPDLLIHLAWEGLPNYLERFHFEENLLSNYRFLKDMINSGLKRCVVTGTCLEYGLRPGTLVESMHTDPTTPYGLAKDALRRFLEQLQKSVDFDLKWLRLFYMYGDGQSPSSVLSQLEHALQNNDEVFNMSGGEQLRDYLHVETAADYITTVAMQERVSGIINCCSGKPISIRRLVENYLRDRRREIKLNLGYYPYPEYEPMAFWGDRRRLDKALGTN